MPGCRDRLSGGPFGKFDKTSRSHCCHSSFYCHSCFECHSCVEISTRPLLLLYAAFSPCSDNSRSDNSCSYNLLLLQLWLRKSVTELPSRPTSVKHCALRLPTQNSLTYRCIQTEGFAGPRSSPVSYDARRLSPGLLLS